MRFSFTLLILLFMSLGLAVIAQAAPGNNDQAAEYFKKYAYLKKSPSIHSKKSIRPFHGTKSELRAKRLREIKEKESKKGFAHKNISPAHKPYQVVRQKAIRTLLSQVGKPYLWGGTSPHAGFDCSGLVYYAYRDLLKFELPRTASEMYHLQDAPLVGKQSLERGDLVFFQIHTTRSADHVGVYLGDGKFIQAPRTGETIRISSLESAYWDAHYLGARRLITQFTIR